MQREITENVLDNPDRPSQVVATDEAVFRSTTLRDIGALKSSVDSLKFEIQELRGNLNKQEESVNELDYCFLYLHLKKTSWRTD